MKCLLPFKTLSIGLLFCAVVSVCVNHSMADVARASTESFLLSPLTDTALQARFRLVEEEGFGADGAVVELEPMVISPYLSTTEQLIEAMKKNYDQFLTGKGWRQNMDYRSPVDEFLNLFSIPFFGISQEFISQMYAQDARLEKRLELMDRISRVRAQELRGLKDSKAYTKDRYDLMRMKRHALFGNSWAVPEFGK